MTVQEITVEEWACDACGRADLVKAPYGKPSGYRGSVQKNHGLACNWYACSVPCIRKAVLQVLELGK